MKNRLLICTIALSLAGSIVVLEPAATAAPKPTTAAKQNAAVTAKVTAKATAKATGKVTGKGTAKGSAPSRQHAPAVARAELTRAMAATAPPTASDTTVIPHLDPSLNAAAGVPGATADPTVKIAPDGSVDVIADGPNVVAAAHSIGLQTGTPMAGQVTLQVPADKLQELAAQPGVSGVHNPAPAITNDAAESEGVAASGAQAWNQATPAIGNQGAGVNIAIVDAGFADLSTEIAAGNLGDASQVVADQSVGSHAHPTANMCGTDYASTGHGTAVAEIAHQMAPQARLYLYCVTDSSDFVDVVNLILSHNAANPAAADQIKIASSSLSFPGEARGDGYTAGSSTEVAVRTAREHGILWIQSAGNSAEDHWTGNFSDVYSYDANNVLRGRPNNWLDFDLATINGVKTVTEADATLLDAGTSGYATFSWDQWNTSNLNLQLVVEEYDITTGSCSTQSPCYLRQQTQAHVPGTAPTLQIRFDNTSDQDREYAILVQYLPAKGSTTVVPPPAIRYDLTLDGGVSPDYLSGLGTAHAVRAAGGSISSPADSPWALAVGAAYVGNATNAGNIATDALESFSSRGPTIDGRAKPDVIGYDGVSTNISEVSSSQQEFDSTTNKASDIPGTAGFYGTSAAAPHVAGAAALILATHPSMDASQLESFLEAPNNNADTVAPQDNVSGHGRLQLGVPDASKVVPANGSLYHSVLPTEIFSTATGNGVAKGPMGPNTEDTVTVPSPLVPGDATAVVVGLLGRGATTTTALSVYPTTYTGDSTLNLSKIDPNATITSAVTLDGNTFKLHNTLGSVDAQLIVYGYFGSSSETTGDGYQPIAPARVLDTRSGIGGAKRKLAPNGQITVNVTAPGLATTNQATVAVVNLTSLNHTGAGWLSAFPSSPLGPHALDYSTYTRENMVLVPVVNNQFTLINRGGTTDVTVDVAGYFSPTKTLRYSALPSPIRVIATPTGTGGRHGWMVANSVQTIDAGGTFGVPYSASALWIAATVSPAKDGFLSFFPAGGSIPHTANLDWTANRVVANQGIATLSASTPATPPMLSTVVRAGQTNLYEIAYGYFAPPTS